MQDDDNILYNYANQENSIKQETNREDNDDEEVAEEEYGEEDGEDSQVRLRDEPPSVPNVAPLGSDNSQ